jgi:GNAT superfamily N-acetyltransferase
MTATVRSATISDLPQMVDLLIADAEHRCTTSPGLWPIAEDAREKLDQTVRKSLEGASAARQEQWLVAEAAGRLVGLTHSMKVPVPPIYAADAGPPGLLLDDCFTTEDAPSGTADALLAATEAALLGTGANKLLIASCAADAPWRSLYERHGYKPVTLYMGKSGFDLGSAPTSVRPAVPDDVPGIVAASARHRKNLEQFAPHFWKIHPDADARFDSWMRSSLTFEDRDMLVSGPPGAVHGYVIAQPIAALLVPAAHDIESIGVIDDYYHADFANPAEISHAGSAAAELLTAAEAAFIRRNVRAAMVVCPAAWSSKVSLLERQGYRTTKLWMTKT